MLAIALIALGCLAAVGVAIWLVLWLATPEPSVPYHDNDGFPQHD